MANEQPPKTIIVGYDGTVPAEQALKRAAEFARVFAARVTVVSVAAPQPLANVGAPGAFGLLPYYVYPEGVEQPGQRNEELWAQRPSSRMPISSSSARASQASSSGCWAAASVRTSRVAPTATC